MSIYIKQTSEVPAQRSRSVAVCCILPGFSAPIPCTHLQSLLGLQLYYLNRWRIYYKSSKHSRSHIPKQLNGENVSYSESSVINTILLNWKRLFQFFFLFCFVLFFKDSFNSVLPAERIQIALRVLTCYSYDCSWCPLVKYIPVVLLKLGSAFSFLGLFIQRTLVCGLFRPPHWCIYSGPLLVLSWKYQLEAALGVADISICN